jgi:hypothetical protein
LPYAAARTSPDATSTDVLPGGPPVGTDGTRLLTEHRTVLERDRRTQPPASPMPPVPGRPPFAERARRATLLVVGALLCGGLVSEYPWYGALVLVLLVWLLRSGSHAAAVAAERRRLRGRTWYDGALLLARAPWELLRSLPATLLLVLWSAGLAVAAALLCYAFVAGESTTLFVCGAVFAGAVYTGPGGAEVRSPLAHVVNPVSRAWKTWLAVTFVLLVLATSLGALAEARGSSWAPGHDRPFSGPSVLPSPAVAPWIS